jgi:hypothetical protein
VSGGAGGAGAYIFGRCLGGGGSSGLPLNSGSNLGTQVLTNPTTTPCLDINTRTAVAGSQSGGGVSQPGVANTGGGGSAATTTTNSYAGANGVVLVRYFLGSTSGLVASYDAQNPASFSGSGSTWNDLSGRGYNATLTGVTKNNSNGGYMEFAGATPHVVLPTLPAAINWSAGVSVSFYANFTTTNNWQRIIDFGTGAQSNNILVARPGSSTDLFIEIWSDASNNSGCKFSSATTTNQWRHYAIGVDGYDCFLYVDGVPSTATVTRTKLTNGSLSNPANVSAVPSNTERTANFIGKSNWNGDAYYNGGIRSIAIYNKSLTANEVNAQKLFQADATAPTISSISISSTPASASYLPGETITVRTVWSESVVATSSPRIPVLGLSSKFFLYSGGSGTNSITFVYVVASGDSAINGIGLSANSFDTSNGSLTDLTNNTPNYNFGAILISTMQRVGSLTSTLTLSLTGNATSVTFRAPVDIIATVSTSGRVTFYSLGKIIAGCRNRPTVTSGSITSTCTWRPAVHSLVTVSATLTPSGGYTPSSSSLSVPVLRRTTKR